MNITRCYECKHLAKVNWQEPGDWLTATIRYKGDYLLEAQFCCKECLVAFCADGLLKACAIEEFEPEREKHYPQPVQPRVVPWQPNPPLPNYPYYVPQTVTTTITDTPSYWGSIGGSAGNGTLNTPFQQIIPNAYPPTYITNPQQLTYNPAIASNPFNHITYEPPKCNKCKKVLTETLLEIQITTAGDTQNLRYCSFKCLKSIAKTLDKRQKVA